MEAWKVDLRRLLTQSEVDKVDPSAIRLILLSHMPSAIYKYRTASTNSLDNLRSSTVWMSSPQDLDDPFDTSQKLSAGTLLLKVLRRFAPRHHSWKPIRDLLEKESFKDSLKAGDPIALIAEKGISKDPSITSKDVTNYVSAVASAVGKELRRLSQWSNNALRSGMKVCCFSETYASILMWSHYADEHRGFCIEWKIDTTSLESPFTGSFYPMLYGNTRFDMTKHIERAVIGKYPNPFIGIAAALYKDPQWEYQREWRIVLPLGFDVESYNMQVPTPSCVLLGAKISEDMEEKVRQIARIARIPVKKMKLSENE
jgi:hypothetical protein